MSADAWVLLGTSLILACGCVAYHLLLGRTLAAWKKSNDEWAALCDEQRDDWVELCHAKDVLLAEALDALQEATR